MAIADNLRSAPRLFFLVFALLFFGGLFVLLAIATPHWLVGVGPRGSPLNAGLWTYCEPDGCVPIPAIGPYIAIRALCMLALLGAGGCGLAALAFVALEQQRKTLGYMIAIGCLLSSLSNTITVILYVISAAISVFVPGWSFILACLGSAGLFFASIIGFVMACNMQSAFGRTSFPS